MKVRKRKMTDKEKFLDKARTYLGVNGKYVCLQKLKLGYVDHWCAFSVSAIMQDCGFIGEYIKEIEGGAGTIPRYSDGKYGTWFKKSVNIPPQAGDLFFLRYEDYPSQDKYFCDHVGIVENVSGDIITTLEGNVDGINGNWAMTSCFKRKIRYLSDYSMYAFYRPYWKGETKTTSTTTLKKTEIYQTTSSAKVDFAVKVTASNGLNIRQGAGIKYKVLGAVPENTVLKVTRQTSGNGYKWGLVTYGYITGWIALDYTDKVTIEQLAKDVIAGKFGNGETRKDKLGSLYDEVQRKVNYILSKI